MLIHVIRVAIFHKINENWVKILKSGILKSIYVKMHKSQYKFYPIVNIHS